MAEIQHTEQGLVAPIELIKIEDGFNIRRDANPSESLVSSIREVGVLDPVHVRTKDADGWLYVVDGECRVKAAQKLGIEEIPIVNEGDIGLADALVISLTSKNQQPYSDREIASGIKRLNDQGVSLDDMAKFLGLSPRSISEYYRVTTEGCKALVNSDIPVRVAARIAEFDKKRQPELIDAVVDLPREEALDVIRTAEKELGTIKPGKKKDIDPLTYPMVKKPRAVLEEFEKIVLKKLKIDKKSERLRGMREAIDVMKGAQSIKDVIS